MSTLFDAMKETANMTETTNGMTSYKSTLDPVLDLFVKGPTLRNSLDKVKSLVIKSYLANKNLTLKCLFYIRDFRGNLGQGEREVFRTGLHEIAKLDPDKFADGHIINMIPYYGRFDDLFCLLGISERLDSRIFSHLRAQLDSDLRCHEYGKSDISLLAKWLPSSNTSSRKSRELAKKIYKSFGWSERKYRKTLSKLRKTIDILETHLSNKDYTFDYSKVPSKANLKYRKCFNRNDYDRYSKHVSNVSKVLSGEIQDKSFKDNVKDLYPYEIINEINRNLYNLNEVDELRLENMWKQLPNYFNDESGHKNWITVIDTSGSMDTGRNPAPIDVAISLGIYIGERNRGIFRNKYITFSTYPCLIDIKEEDSLKEKFLKIKENSIISNTDIEKVFELILDTAVKHNISKDEMPEVIVIISDMQFDYCVNSGDNPSVYKMISKKYNDSGYKLPKLVFWNASNDYYSDFPVTKHELGAILVSGCKPGMFEQILSGKTPIDFMNQVLNNERYSSIYIENPNSNCLCFG